MRLSRALRCAVGRIGSHGGPVRVTPVKPGAEVRGHDCPPPTGHSRTGPGFPFVTADRGATAWRRRGPCGAPRRETAQYLCSGILRGRLCWARRKIENNGDLDHGLDRDAIAHGRMEMPVPDCAHGGPVQRSRMARPLDLHVDRRTGLVDPHEYDHRPRDALLQRPLRILRRRIVERLVGIQSRRGARLSRCWNRGSLRGCRRRESRLRRCWRRIGRPRRSWRRVGLLGSPGRTGSRLRVRGKARCETTACEKRLLPVHFLLPTMMRCAAAHRLPAGRRSSHRPCGYRIAGSARRSRALAPS